MTRDELVEARLYFDQREAIAAMATLRAHGIECTLVGPDAVDDAPIPTAAGPYRLHVAPEQVDRVDRLLGDRREDVAEPSFEVPTDERNPKREPSPEEIAAGLDAVRTARAASWVIWLAALPVFLALLAGGVGGFLAAAIALVGMVVLLRRLNRTPCPRCGKPFQEARFGFNLLTRECLHCHLPMNGERRRP